MYEAVHARSVYSKKFLANTSSRGFRRTQKPPHLQKLNFGKPLCITVRYLQRVAYSLVLVIRSKVLHREFRYTSPSLSITTQRYVHYCLHKKI